MSVWRSWVIPAAPRCTPFTPTWNCRSNAMRLASWNRGSDSNRSNSRRRNKVPAPKNEPKAAPAAVKSEGRKPWKKKSPVEVVLEQAEKLKTEIAEAEEELKAKRKQLQKFEEAKKIFEAI